MYVIQTTSYVIFTIMAFYSVNTYGHVGVSFLEIILKNGNKDCAKAECMFCVVSLRTNDKILRMNYNV